MILMLEPFYVHETAVLAIKTRKKWTCRYESKICISSDYWVDCDLRAVVFAR